MDRYTFKLPDIGEGIAQAEIVAWHVKAGDWLEEDAPLADVMTDKATVEMTAPVSGRVIELAGEAGEQVAIGSILAVFEVEAAHGLASDGRDTVTERRASGPAPATAAPEEAAVAVHLAQVSPKAGSDLETPSFSPAATAQPTKKTRASPAVRARARVLGIDLEQIRPDGDGRIRHADLDGYLRYNGGSGYRNSHTATADEPIKVIGLRRRIAENMAASKRHIPHFSYVEEIDMTKLEALRADLNAARGERPRLTVLPFIAMALCRGVAEHPMMNALYDDESGIVTRKGAVHLGVATQTDAGLLVPVLRDTQDLNVWQIAAEIARLAEGARDGRLSRSDLSGSTITLTSLGPLGGIATTPVINRPEVAIIGPNRIVERPVVRGGRHETALMMNLSISCDHRVVDGWDAASFVQVMRRLLETPALLFAD